MIACRWGDNDTYVGPLTFAKDEWRHFAIVLASGDDDGRRSRLRFSGFGRTMIVALPDWVVRPERKKVFPQWDAATVQRLGRNWYWDLTPREFGFTISDGHLSVAYGRQSNDSSTEQCWGWFLPWTQWRFVRHSLYDLDGELFAHMPRQAPGLGGRRAYWDEHRRIEEACPASPFAFLDFDGEALTATTKIEEREWLFGTGAFKWLSLFRRPKVRRSLDIHFSGETGKRKGSWKGGTIGHSIDMLPGERHRSAFERYCGEHAMTFVGEAATPRQQRGGR